MGAFGKEWIILTAMIFSLIQLSSEQIDIGNSVNRQSNIQNESRFQNNSGTRSLSEQPSIHNGINIGESFFLNRLRQGDSEAFMRLGQLHQTADTPMSLLHNFFQVFNRPDVSQRTGIFSLLHNLAVARGLLPNSLAIGNTVLQNTENSVPKANTIDSPSQTLRGVSDTSFETTDSNSMLSKVNGQVNDLNTPINSNTLNKSEVSDSGEISNSFGIRNFTSLKNGVSSIPLTSNNIPSVTILNNIVPANDIRSSRVNINRRQSDVDKINTIKTNSIRGGIRGPEISGRTVSSDIVGNVSENIIPNTALVDRFPTGGRFSSPLTRLQARKFSQRGSDQRGAHTLTRSFVPKFQNGTTFSTLREIVLNRTKTPKRIGVFNITSKSNTISELKRPSKLNFMLEMPKGVTLANLTGISRQHDILIQNKDIDTDSSRRNTGHMETVAIKETGKQVGYTVVKQFIKNVSDSRKDISKIRDKIVSNTSNMLKNIRMKQDGNISVNHFIEEAGKRFDLQNVGHIQLDPTDHILQLVGEMNLTLSEAEYTIQRVGDLNLGQRRRFVMEITVNSSSNEDKILLQRVGSTDIVPSERIQLHGTGDVRLLTKERVIIQRLGFVTFQNDPLKSWNPDATEKSTRTEEVRSIFRVEPLTGDTTKPHLLFLGNETNLVLNETSNETVLQFVGDVLSEIPVDELNITQETRSRNVQNIPELISSATRSERMVVARDNSELPFVKGSVNDSGIPVLQESMVSKTLQKRISNNVSGPARIHLHSIGRIFSTAEMKFENN